MRSGATNGELPNRDFSQWDSAIARLMARYGGSRKIRTKPNRKPEGNEPEDVVYRGQTIRAQRRHRCRIDPQENQEITSKCRMSKMATVRLDGVAAWE